MLNWQTEARGWNGRGRGRPTQGYALLLLMMVVTLLLVAMTAALPSIYTEAQREREEELIFRGNEYARAIAFFHRQFNRYPTSVDELLKKTNGVRFLRHAYTEPMSKNGKWRLIHANAQGILLDSLTQSSALGGVGPGMRGPAGQMGATTGPGLTTGAPTAASGSSSEEATKKAEDLTKKLEEEARKACAEGSGSSGSSSSGGGQFGGGGTYIAGVASCSPKESIRIWNGKTHYEEWEFLGAAVSPGGMAQPGAAPVAPGAAGSTGGGMGPGAGAGTGGGSTGQPGTPPQAAPQQPEVPPLTEQPEQPEQPGQPPEEPQP